MANLDIPALPDPHFAWAFRPARPLAGAAGGPLTGLTFNVKDLYGVEGWPLAASTRAPLPPVAPSPLVTRLLALGATATGKTHLHEIAMGTLGEHPFSPLGATLHPELPGRVAGGSSCGAGVTARLGEVDFALGTDTGGSIRVPAAWCGVYGYKPTKGAPAWPTAGILPLSPSCDHAGILARDFATVVRVHTALTGQAAPPLSWQGVRVGVWHPTGWIAAEILSALKGMAAKLAAAGATLAPLELPDMLDAYSVITGSEAAQVHAAALAKSDPGFSPDILEKLRIGQRRTAAERAAASTQRERYQALLAEQFKQVDVILAPVTPTLPPKLGQHEAVLGGQTVNLRPATLRLNVPFSMLGTPAVALPTAAPWAGVQLIASWQADAYLLGLAQALTELP